MTEKIPVPEPGLSEEDLRTIEAMRHVLVERDELRFLPALAASLLENEVPLLVAEVRRLRARLEPGREP